MNDFTVEAEVEEDSIAVEDVGAEEIEEEVDPTDESESEDVEDDQEDSEEDEDDEEEAEEIEFNFGGKKVQFSKKASVEEVASELQTFASNIEAAHTKRSQMVADAAKELQAREQTISKLEQLEGETLEIFGQGLSLRSEIERLEQAQRDPANSWDADPDRARQISDLVEQKKAEYKTIYNEVTQREQYSTQLKSQTLAQQQERGKQIVEKIIPGFEEKFPQVQKYVTETFGVSPEDAKNWGINPAGAVMAYESMKYRELTSKAKKKSKPAVKAVEAVKSIKAKGSKASRPLNSPKLSPEEYRERWLARSKKRYHR